MVDNLSESFRKEDIDTERVSQLTQLLLSESQKYLGEKKDCGSTTTLPKLEIGNGAGMQAAVPEVGTDSVSNEAKRQQLVTDGQRKLEAGDKPQESAQEREQTKIAKEMATALLSGNSMLASDALRRGFENGPSKAQFDAFTKKVRAELGEGFDVRNAIEKQGPVLTIHRQGATNGYEFVYKRDSTGSVLGTSYDWVTKNDSGMTFAEIAKDFRQPLDRKADTLKDHRQLADLFEQGKATNDYTAALKAMSKSADHVFRQAETPEAGLKAVAALESKMRSQSKDSPIQPLFVVESDGSMKAVATERLTKLSELQRATEDLNYRLEKGIVKHPELGHIKILDRGPAISKVELPKRQEQRQGEKPISPGLPPLPGDKPSEGNLPSRPSDKPVRPGLPLLPGDKPSEGNLPSRPSDKPVRPGLPPLPGDKPSEEHVPSRPADKPVRPGLPPLPGDKPSEGNLPSRLSDKPVRPGLPPLPGDKPSEGNLPSRPSDKQVRPGLPPLPGDKPSEGNLPSRPSDKPVRPGLPPLPGDKPSEGNLPSRPSDKPVRPGLPPLPGDKPSDGNLSSRPSDKPVRPGLPPLPGDKPSEEHVPSRPADKPVRPGLPPLPGDKPSEEHVPSRPADKPVRPGLPPLPGDKPV